MISAVSEFIDDMRGGRMVDSPVVNVEQGQLQGKVANIPSGHAFYSFQGIPYAKPPLGSLRFKAPQPAEPWEGVRDATAEGNISAQFDPFIHKQYVGDENCLFLNVYTPNLDGAFLPVMIFIHGGGFKHGSGNTSFYGGDYIVEKDVVLVTINYRCGPLGFLSLNTPEVPGNAGLKDIVQAIRWVKDNIHNFGGNSGNITIFGESCGGVAVSVLTVSPLTKNLISKAIIQSGTGLNSWAWQKHPIDNARSLAKLLGCDSDDVEEIHEFLLATSVRDIVEAYEKLYPPEIFYEKGLNMFAPVVEKEFPGVEAVITEEFINLLTSGRVAQIPIMIGSTTLEFTFQNTPDDLQVFIPEDFNIERNTEEALAISQKLKEVYFKGNHIGVESLNEYFELLSDKLVNVDTHRYVQYLVKATNKPIYYYKFDYVGELNLSKKLLASLGLKHAGHMDELGYLFKNIFQKDVEPTSQDLKTRERMLRLWTNFAKSGNPTPEENHFINVKWLPVTQDNLYFLNISNELSLGTNPDKEKMDLWDSLYNKYFKIWEQNANNKEAKIQSFDSEPVAVAEERNDEVPEERNDEVPEERNDEVAEERNDEVAEERKDEVAEESKNEVSVESKDEVSGEHDDKTADVSPIQTIDEPKDAVVIVEESRTVVENGNTIQESFVSTVLTSSVEIIESSERSIEEEQHFVDIEEQKPVLESVREKIAEMESRENKDVKIVEEEKKPVANLNSQNGFVNGNGIDSKVENAEIKKPRPSNEIKMVQNSNGTPKDVIRANDPPEDDLPKNIGVNKFVNFFESLGAKK